MQVAIRALRDTTSGLAQIILDPGVGGNITLDLSSFYGQTALVWRSDLQPYGNHSLRVTCLAQGGPQSNGSAAVSIAGFWVQTSDVVSLL